MVFQVYTHSLEPRADREGHCQVPCRLVGQVHISEQLKSQGFWDVNNPKRVVHYHNSQRRHHCNKHHPYLLYNTELPCGWVHIFIVLVLTKINKVVTKFKLQQTFCTTQNCPVAGSCSAVDRSIVISPKTTLTLNLLYKLL